MTAICLNLVFRYKFFKYQFQFRIQYLQIGYCTNFQVGLTFQVGSAFNFGTIFDQILIKISQRLI